MGCCQSMKTDDAAVEVVTIEPTVDDPCETLEVTPHPLPELPCTFSHPEALLFTPMMVCRAGRGRGQVLLAVSAQVCAEGALRDQSGVPA